MLSRVSSLSDRLASRRKAHDIVHTLLGIRYWPAQLLAVLDGGTSGRVVTAGKEVNAALSKAIKHTLCRDNTKTLDDF